ncbi:MAG: peptidylprolyl isomerase [Coleofasciculaceae cyanobacterium RL_1_1]|nr:peptidylprolyl isomerase [Coleofasciculaceae cyanobacterium RL_1_1]
MNTLGRWLRIVPIAAILMSLSIGLSGAWFGDVDNYRESRMPVGNAVTDPNAILQYALPIDNAPVRRMQQAIEVMSQDLRGGQRWSAVSSDIRTAKNTLTIKRDELLADVSADRRDQAIAIIDELKERVATVEAAIENRDRDTIWAQRRMMLNTIGQLEALMVGEFPFEIPAEYADLPQLKGRATVEIETEKGSIELILDGFNAPITAGNFVDLVQRGFYAGTEVNRAEEYYVVQAGDPPGADDGFIDPATGKERTIPLEIKVTSEPEPVYGATLEDVGLYRESPALPFSAYGTVAMAHRDDDPNTASSQFFFFLFEPELTPPGLNLLDGRYSVFGYVKDGGEAVLSQLKKGDKIVSARVIDGLDYFVPGHAA